jgi:hypothetical protein
MSSVEERRARKQRKLEERLAVEQRKRTGRTAKRLALYGALGLLLVGGGTFAITQAITAKVYPPTGMQDHIESYPPCRICSSPIPEAIQRHILEHREPGTPGDRPGILVQYSCASCPEVVATLTRIVERYPRAVYLAPYPSMSPRIALTTLGQLETMDQVDEAQIVAFIEKHL